MAQGITIQLDKRSKREVDKMFKKSRAIADKTTWKHIVESAEEMATDARRGAPVAEGTLKKEIKTSYNKNRLKGEVQSNAPHSYFVEYGRQPGKPPPIAPILQWCKKVLRLSGSQMWGTAKVIQKNIGERGTPAQPYFFPAYDRMAANFFKDLKNKLRTNLRKAEK